MTVRIAGATHQGAVRDHNEDCYWIDNELQAAIVSDGMGGHAAGEVASAITVDSFKKVVAMRLSRARSINDVKKVLSNSVGLANQEVRIASQAQEEQRRMGATAVCACLWNRSFVVASIGDSRAYLILDGSITRLTRDDSIVQRLVEGGYIGETQARIHPQKNLITRHIGGEEKAIPAITILEVDAGFRMLLCSDGLTGELRDEEILTVVESAGSVEEACEDLIAAALDRGAADNVTAVMFETG